MTLFSFPDHGRPIIPGRYWALFTFDAEKARGLVHTSEYTSQMAVLREQFDMWKLEHPEACDLP